MIHLEGYVQARQAIATIESRHDIRPWDTEPTRAETAGRPEWVLGSTRLGRLFQRRRPIALGR